MKSVINTHYHNSNLIRLIVSRRVDEVIPSDHPGREASRVIRWYGLIHEARYCTPDQVTIMIVYLLYTFSDIILRFWSLILKNCGNVCHYVKFLDVTSSCFPSLVSCLKNYFK